MDTFGAPLFYGSGAVFAEYRSAWKQGQPDIQIYVKEGVSWEWRLSLRSSIALICQFIAALHVFGQELAVAFMFFSSDPLRSDVATLASGAARARVCAGKGRRQGQGQG